MHQPFNHQLPSWTMFATTDSDPVASRCGDHVTTGLLDQPSPNIERKERLEIIFAAVDACTSVDLEITHDSSDGFLAACTGTSTSRKRQS